MLILYSNPINKIHQQILNYKLHTLDSTFYQYISSASIADKTFATVNRHLSFANNLKRTHLNILKKSFRYNDLDWMAFASISSAGLGTHKDSYGWQDCKRWGIWYSEPLLMGGFGFDCVCSIPWYVY